MAHEVVKQVEDKMKQALAHFREEMKNIRTSRANPGMVENVMVEAYGAPMRIKDVATITSPEPRQLVITPFDPHNCGAIGKAIEKANIGMRPIVEGNLVRLQVPPMDESVRKEMVKILHRKLEECKISVRNIRRDSNENIKKRKSSGDISEDEMNGLEKQVQDLTDKFCKEAESLSLVKEKEVVTI